MDTKNAIDRIAYTDVDTALRHYGKGTIWLASNECQLGRNVGDRVLRRIIEDFHSQQADPQFANADRLIGRRRLYQYEDQKTDKKLWVSAKVAEDRTPAAKCTVHYVIAVSGERIAFHPARSRQGRYFQVARLSGGHWCSFRLTQVQAQLGCALIDCRVPGLHIDVPSAELTSLARIWEKSSSIRTSLGRAVQSKKDKAGN